MAKNAATWEGRRALTDNPNTPTQTYLNAGRSLTELDQLAEAAVMFGLAKDEAGLGKISDQAVDEGNFFLFQAVAARLGADNRPTRGQIQALIEAAEKSGKVLYAEKAKEYLEKM